MSQQQAPDSLSSMVHRLPHGAEIKCQILIAWNRFSRFMPFDSSPQFLAKYGFSGVSNIFIFPRI